MRRYLAAATRELTVASAGLAAANGAPIDPVAERTLVAHGHSAQAHRARQLDREELGRSDLVLAMEQRHIAALLALSPSLRGKAFLLSHWQDGADIRDPFGRAQDAFENVYERIESAIRIWKERL